MEWNDEIFEIFTPCQPLGEVKFERAVAAIGGPRENEEDFYGAFADHTLDVIPKYLAAKQLCQIAPDAIAFLRELKGQPQRELIVVGVRVAHEQNVVRMCSSIELEAILYHPRPTVQALRASDKDRCHRKSKQTF